MAEASNLYQRLILLSRLAPLVGFVLVITYQAAEHDFDIQYIFDLGHLQSRHGVSFLIATIVFGLLMPLASWWLLRWITGRVAEQEQTEQQLRQTYHELQLSHRRLTLLNEISRRVAEAPDLDAVLTVAVEIPSQLIRVAHCTIYLVDEMSGNLVATKSYPTSEHPPSEREGPRSASTEPGPLGAIPSGPPHLSFLLNHADHVIGALNLHLPQGYFPNDDEVRLLQTLSNGVAATIESMRLRARHLLTIYEVDKTLRAESNLNRLLSQLLAKVMSVCRAHCGALLLHEQAGRQLRVHSATRCGESKCPICAHMPFGFARQAPFDISPQLLVDVEREPVWEKEALPPGIRSLLSMPLIAQGEPIGLIVLGHPQPGVFGESQLNLLSVVASQAALAVHNAQLYIDAEQLAIVEERSRIAREIHDGVAQSLAFLRLKLEICQDFLDDRERLRGELETSRQILLEKIEELHRAIYALRPVELEKLGFVPALRKLAKDFEESHPFGVELTVRGDPTRLSSRQELAFFRVVQEFLNNTAKHAQARHIWIELDMRSPERARVELRDDGRGFDPVLVQSKASPRGQMGLVQMEERIRSLGGVVKIDAAPGKGTRLVTTLPLESRGPDGFL